MSFPLSEDITVDDIFDLFVGGDAPATSRNEPTYFTKADGGALFIPWGQVARIVEIMP